MGIILNKSIANNNTFFFFLYLTGKTLQDMYTKVKYCLIPKEKTLQDTYIIIKTCCIIFYS